MIAYSKKRWTVSILFSIGASFFGKKVRMKKTPGKESELRGLIIKKALELIDKKGFDGFSLREVARELGVSHGAPYRHFADKDALISQITVEGFLILSECLQNAFVQDVSPVEQLAEMGRQYLEFALAHPDYYRLLFDKKKYVNTECLEGDPESIAGNATFEILENQIRKISPEKTPEEISADALIVWSSVHGLAMLLLSGNLLHKGFSRENKEALHGFAFERIIRILNLPQT